ncbi:MAG: ABC transporter permease [Oscillospiraceae bacterium]|nr:ABC transporter permease [Oscillospiraceae bacterium]
MKQSEAKAVSASPRAPLFHIARRDRMHPAAAWGVRVGAFVLALLLNTLFVWFMIGVNPITFYGTMLKGIFGNSISIWATLKESAKLLCIAVALAPAFKMRFWNIGAEGQVLIGGMAAAFLMHDYPSIPGPVLLLLMLVAGVIAGGIWGLLPAFFKAKLNANETLFTLMMNYIAARIVWYFCHKWSDKALGIINQDTQRGWLSSLWGGGSNGSWLQNEDFWFIVIVAVIAILMYFYLRLTKQGYEISVVGESHNTARYAGISVNKVILRTMLISGAICGLCGFLIVSAQGQTIKEDLAGGYGFTAIIVAWLSKFNTFTMAGVSLLIVALERGAGRMSEVYENQGFSAPAASVLVGVTLLLVIGSEFFIQYRILRNHSGKEAAA